MFLFSVIHEIPADVVRNKISDLMDAIDAKPTEASPDNSEAHHLDYHNEWYLNKVKINQKVFLDAPIIA